MCQIENITSAVVAEKHRRESVLRLHIDREIRDRGRRVPQDLQGCAIRVRLDPGSVSGG